jgi:hypothetical protein
VVHRRVSSGREMESQGYLIARDSYMHNTEAEPIVDIFFRERVCEPIADISRVKTLGDYYTLA